MAIESHAMGAERACAPGSMVLLTRLAKQVYRRSSEELLGMHLRHLVALSYVRDHDGCPQQELAEALCMDANNVVLLLNELEELGYVTRLRDPHDRRRHWSSSPPRALRRWRRRARPGSDRGRRPAALDAEERATLWKLLDPRALQAPSRPMRADASALQRHDRVDLDLSALRQLRHADRDARRRIAPRRSSPYTSLTSREGRQVGHVDGQPHGPLQRRARRRADGARGSPGSARACSAGVSPTSSPVTGSSGI